MKCAHENFKAAVDVNRLSEKDGGPVTHYSAEVFIKCADCELAFEFVGLPLGLSPYRPTVSMDGVSLRVPIMPPGYKVPEGLPSFSAKFNEAKH